MSDGGRRRELITRARSLGSRRLVAAPALVLGGALIAWLAAGAIAESRRGYDPLLLSGVLLLSAVLTIVVLFVLGRNVVKLYLANRRGAPGSRYRTRVITLLTGLTLLPALLLFFTASGIVQQAVGQWFEPEVDRVFEAGHELVTSYSEQEERRVMAVAQRVIADIAEQRLLRRSVRRSLQKYVDEKQHEYGLAGLRVYNRLGDVIAEGYEDDREEGLKPLQFPPSDVTDLLEGRRQDVRWAPDKTGEILWFRGLPVTERDRVAGAVIVAAGLGRAASGALTDIDDTYLLYQDARAHEQDVKRAYVLVLAFFTLVLLFSAFWVGSSLAKRMTVPLQNLGDATRAVSEGRFDFRVDEDAPDELGSLARSFNQMLDELRQGRQNVETSTRDLRRSNLEIEERRRYIETILESVPTGVITIDRGGRVTNINASAVEMLGLEPGRFERVHFRELFEAKEFLELGFLIEKVMGIRDINLTRELHLRLNRRAVDLAVSFTSLRDSQEREIGLILVLEDMSNLIKAQKIAAWREVARRIAHEIKNPLTPIQLSAQRILKKWRKGDSDIDSVIEDCTETITKEVDGLKTLVNEFSRFARMPPVSLAPTDIDKVIHNSLVLYEGLYPKLTVERHVASDIPTMSLDTEQMKRVLINLLDNAIHCQGGIGRVLVTASHDDRSQSVRIAVADEGPGIPPEDRERLFVPYFSTRKGGTGLGLAIVHRIVSDHNGRIRVEDNLPRGTRFVIELPA